MPELLKEASLNLRNYWVRQTLISRAGACEPDSARTTRARNSAAPVHGAGTADSKEISKLSPARYSRLLRNRIPFVEKSTLMASSNQGTCSGRTRMGKDRACRKHERRSCPPRRALPLVLDCAVGAKCKASRVLAEPLVRANSRRRAMVFGFVLSAPFGASPARTTFAGISGWPSPSELSNGNVTQSEAPGWCASVDGTSKPPREIFRVSQTSVLCPKGVVQRSLIGRLSCAR